MMKAIWLENKAVSLREIPIPSPTEGEVLVKVIRAGICNTDLELTKGYYPYTGVIGHEFVGEVRAPGRLQDQTVVGEINLVCHQCDLCLQGLRRHCENRTVLGIVDRAGAFAEYLCLPEENLLVVPESVSVAEACFAEPLAAALEIQEQIDIKTRDRVLVIGDGKLGLLIAQSLALTGCQLMVLGRHGCKLKLLSARGIPTTRELEAIRPRSFDIAVECTGDPSGFEIARAALRPRGTLVLKSTYAGDVSLPSACLVVDELTLVGSRCGPMDKALELLGKKQLDLASLIQGEYPLSEGLAAMEQAAGKGALKIQLLM